MNALSHIWGLRNVFILFGWKVHCLPIEICRTIKLVLGSLKCLNMTCFQRDTGCFQTWIDTVWVIGCTPSAALFSTINLFHQCVIQTTIQSTWIWKGSASELMLPSYLRMSQLVVCASFSALWINGTINHSFLGERGHTWMSRKWAQFLGCLLSKILLILLCLFKVTS